MERQSDPNDGRYPNAGLRAPGELGAGATTRPRRVAFVLSGGGSLGSIQVGAMEALLENGIYPDMIVGTSVGALNGALLAREPTLDGVRGIRDIWLSLERGAVFTGGRRLAFFRLLFGMDHLYTNKGLRRLVTRNLGPITFADLSLPFLATAADVEEGTVHVFDTGPLLPALLASTAVPGIFPPVTIDGRKYVDGAILSYCNIETAWQRGATHIVMIESVHRVPDDAFGVLGPIAKALWAAEGRQCRTELERFGSRLPTLLVSPDVNVDMDRRERFTAAKELMSEAREWTLGFLESKSKHWSSWKARTSTS